MKVSVLDLFSGIGGFSLGLERAGMETIAFCEIDEKAKLVLNKHWPQVKKYSDIKELTLKKLLNDGIEKPDIICGGFPCQDISKSGKLRGINGERSGLWSEFFRLINEIQPRYAIVENVSNLLSGDRGSWFGRILADLAEIGYDAEWHCIPASLCGLPQIRERVWIITYPHGTSGKSLDIQESIFINKKEPCRRELTRAVDACIPADDYSKMRGNYNGVSEQMDRIRQIGNAVVPQIPELIGNAILKSMI